MKNLNQREMLKIKGGEFSNRDCLFAGAGTLIAIVGFQWGVSIGLTTSAAIGGCFEKW